MPFEPFDRARVRFRPLRERKNKIRIERDHVAPTAAPRDLASRDQDIIGEVADRMRLAREHRRSRMLVFGAHTIKNGLAPVLIRLIEDGWITHLATNGAGIIHDWEFAYLGESSEDVRTNLPIGEFGTWEETGYYLNLALAVGAFRGLGYGESVGAMIEREGLDIPSREELLSAIHDRADSDPGYAAGAADLLDVLRGLDLEPGALDIPHPYKRFSVQATAHRLRFPFTAHPMIGHDIIYAHPMNRCAAVGRTAERDFLTFVNGVANLDGGVYLSIGSAVMSPMIFEKALSMARNVAHQDGRRIEGHCIAAVDLAESTWDWTGGEPPEDHPDYYLRYNKSFSRAGGDLRTLSADNRDFLLGLVQALQSL